MSIQYHDPKASPSVAATPYELSINVDQPMTVGLLANGFPDSVEFLDAVEKTLHRALPSATIKRYNKRGASVPCSDELMSDIAEECDAFISAYGH